MQNGIYEEGWSEFSNRFSMNLTKVLFVVFIFLFALSFAAAAEEEATEREKQAATAGEDKLETRQRLLKANTLAETESETKRGTEKAATHFKGRVSLLVRYGGFFLWACVGLFMVYPKSGAMAWIMRKLPTLYFEVLQEVSEDIKQSHPYQIFEWFYVSYKGYSLPFEALFLVSGVFLSAANRKETITVCVYLLLKHGILAILFVGINISSYLRWEVPILNEEGHNVSKTVKASDHTLRMLIFGSALLNLVGAKGIHFDPHFRSSPLNRVPWVFLPLWIGVTPWLLLALYVIMFCHTIIFHSPFVDVIATYIVFAGIYLPLLLVIEDVVRVIILPRIWDLSPDPKVVQSGAIAEGMFRKPNPEAVTPKPKSE